MLPPLQRIDLLPEHLIDQIKAGEVIERPGNLIKEILENSVDAGAEKIELTVRNNGLDLISLKDDGHGIPPGDLPLAFSRHATSKIVNFDDLYRLSSFGFRGEALASIAAISRLQCISFTSRENLGSEIRIEGGQTMLHEERTKTHQLQGTEFVIQDLFYNTPARLKFVQSQSAEKQFIRKVVYSFVITKPEVEFVVRLDAEEKDLYPRASSISERLLQLYPKAQGAILYTERTYERVRLNLFIWPGSLKGPVKCANIHINGRYILDRQLHRVTQNALQAAGRDDFQYLVLLDLDPASIDVNVHPSKTVVKCQDISKVIGLVTASVKELGGLQRSGTPPVDSGLLTLPTAELPGLDDSSARSLPQTRHEYNLEGFFSPHAPVTREERIIWIGENFLHRFEDRWVAVSARRLLAHYIAHRAHEKFVSTPLLVSEPFPRKLVSPDQLERLGTMGLELETLGSETIVLRSIPDWMNGFPLREVLGCLLRDPELRNLSINPADWSQSSWEEMLRYLSTEDLKTQRILLELESLIQEKLR